MWVYHGRASCSFARWPRASISWTFRSGRGARRSRSNCQAAWGTRPPGLSRRWEMGSLILPSVIGSPMPGVELAPMPNCVSFRRGFAIKLPNDVGCRQAAAMMLKGMTAQVLVKQIAKSKPGDTVLFHAASSGVGVIACQWLKHLGVKVIGTVGSDEKASAALANGCDHVIVYTREDIETRVLEITKGAKVAVVFDSLGAATFLKSLNCIQPRGPRDSIRTGIRPGRARRSGSPAGQWISVRHPPEPECVHLQPRGFARHGPRPF